MFPGPRCRITVGNSPSHHLAVRHHLELHHSHARFVLSNQKYVPADTPTIAESRNTFIFQGKKAAGEQGDFRIFLVDGLPDV